MKAIRVHETGGADKLRLEDLPDPVPGEGEVLVRLAASGLNFIDIYHRSGLYQRPLPYTPGSEGAGTVVAAGPGVSSFKPGDKVASESFRGSYAQLGIAAAARLVHVPAGISDETAAAVMIQGLTAHYLATSTFPLGKGTWCLVHAAAGGTGQLLVQMARLLGARVIGTVSTAEKEKLARQAGAEEVIRYTEKDVVGEVKRITGGAGVQVVYDSVGRATFEGSLDSLAPRGMLVSFGQSSGAVPPFDPLVLSRKGSLYLTRPTITHYTRTREELEARAAQVFGWITAEQLRVRIDRKVPLAEAASAQRALEQRETMGKVLLQP